MGWLSVLLGYIAALLFCGKEQFITPMIISAVAAAGCLWSWGICHSYAANLAQRRKNYTGRFYDITNAEAEAIPDWIAVVNLAFSLLSLVMFILAIKCSCR